MITAQPLHRLIQARYAPLFNSPVPGRTRVLPINPHLRQCRSLLWAFHIRRKTLQSGCIMGAVAFVGRGTRRDG